MRAGGETFADPLAESFAPTVQVRAYRVDGQAERDGDALIAAFLLVIEDEHGAFDFGQRQEFFVDRALGVCVVHKLLGGAGVLAGQAVAGEVFEPPSGGVFVEEGWLGSEDGALTATAFPLVLREIDDDAIEVGGDGSVTAKLRQSAVEAEEGFLGEVFDVRAGAGHA